MNSNEIKIEKGIPFPTKSTNGWSKYPFDKMEIGESFRLTNPTVIRTAIAVYYKRTKTIKRFTVRKYLTSYRCWRIEDEPALK